MIAGYASRSRGADIYRMAAFAEFERQTLISRTKEGMTAAKLAWLAAQFGCSWENSAGEPEPLREAINQKRRVKKGGYGTDRHKLDFILTHSSTAMHCLQEFA